MSKIKTKTNGTKKEMIRLEAAKLFRQKGFSATSMRNIAEALGIEAPSLYNHLKSKDELLQDICFDMATKYTKHMDEVESSTDSVIHKIERIIRFNVQINLHHTDEVYVTVHDWKMLAEPYLTNFLSQRRNYEKRFSQIIELGVHKNEIKQTEPYIAMLTIMSAVRAIEYWQRHRKDITEVAMEENMVTHLLTGLKA
jgi:TetR/AcrR family transcriptional regulator, cholesterol catabolism regulator